MLRLLVLVRVAVGIAAGRRLQMMALRATAALRSASLVAVAAIQCHGLEGIMQRW
jgi:hypothetical protein